jgi:hypothetical protein
VVILESPSLVHEKLQFSYPWASIKDVKATEEVFIPEKRTSSTSETEFLHFRGLFLPSWKRIRIRSPNADPDPADHNGCGSGSTTLLKVMEVKASLNRDTMTKA